MSPITGQTIYIREVHPKSSQNAGVFRIDEVLEQEGRKVKRRLGKPTPQSRISTSAGRLALSLEFAQRRLRTHDDNRQIPPQCLPVSPRPASTAATSRPVKVVLASTASLPVVAVWPVVSTTTVPTSTSTTLVTSVRLV